jgi:hypothetical protein
MGRMKVRVNTVWRSRTVHMRGVWRHRVAFGSLDIWGIVMPVWLVLLLLCECSRLFPFLCNHLLTLSSAIANTVANEPPWEHVNLTTASYLANPTTCDLFCDLFSSNGRLQNTHISRKHSLHGQRTDWHRAQRGLNIGSSSPFAPVWHGNRVHSQSHRLTRKRFTWSNKRKSVMKGRVGAERHMNATKLKMSILAASQNVNFYYHRTGT